MRAIVLLCLLHAAFAVIEKNNWDGPISTPEQDVPNVCLLDQASCGCCLIQKQLQRLEGYFTLTAYELNKTLTDSKTALNNIRTSRVAFSVAFNNNTDFNCFGLFLVNKMLIYQYVFINLGGNYNPSTGIFIVPLTGVYSFTVTVHGTSTSGVLVCTNLQVNNEVVSAVFEQNGQDPEDSNTLITTMKLKAADQVAVSLIKGCFICDNYKHYNTFTGFLVYPTPS